MGRRASFYSLSVPHNLSLELPQLAPLITLASAAMVGSRIRVAVWVITDDFRHRAILAEEMASTPIFSHQAGSNLGWTPGRYLATTRRVACIQ